MTVHDSLIVAVKMDDAFEALAGARIFHTAALGRGATPDRPQVPWAGWKELPATNHTQNRKLSTAKTRTYQFFVYDEPGIYEDINKILAIIERVVKDFAPCRTASGILIHEATWEGLSGDLEDDGYGCAVRFGTASLVCSA